MKIKICGLFRREDIDYVNEARPDYAGFVFAESRRQVSPYQAEQLRKKLGAGIIPAGVFVDAPAEEIAALYRDGIIGTAQLHGAEDEEYIAKLKGLCNVPIIKTITVDSQSPSCFSLLADYLLFDSGAGSGKPFNWNLLEPQINKPWFLAGGINRENIERAMAFEPYAIDISSGAETDGVKDREKILQLTLKVKKEMLNE